MGATLHTPPLGLVYAPDSHNFLAKEEEPGNSESPLQGVQIPWNMYQTPSMGRIWYLFHLLPPMYACRSGTQRWYNNSCLATPTCFATCSLSAFLVARVCDCIVVTCHTLFPCASQEYVVKAHLPLVSQCHLLNSTGVSYTQILMTCSDVYRCM